MSTVVEISVLRVEPFMTNMLLFFSQVEAALTTDPGNDDLIKLQTDLQVRQILECIFLYW